MAGSPSGEGQDDRWLDWLLRGRDAGEASVRSRSLAFLQPIFDRVLEGARLCVGDVVLEAGAGEGRLGLMGLEAVGPTGHLILADVSESVVRHLEGELLPRLADHVEVLGTPVESLAGVTGESVDVVLVRSVLIYSTDLAAAFSAFSRVLKPGGRLSLFEPLWGFFAPASDPGEFFGWDLGEVAAEAEEVVSGFGTGPSGFVVSAALLVSAAEEAGFRLIRVAVDAESAPLAPGDDATVQQALHGRPNPNAPSVAEVASKVLSAGRADRFLQVLESAVRSGRGRTRSAAVYLTADR